MELRKLSSFPRHVSEYQLAPCSKLPLQNEGTLKVPRLASPQSSSLQAAEFAPSFVVLDKVALPSGEMDALDAVEAAKFKADVQGHRLQEVGRA